MNTFKPFIQYDVNKVGRDFVVGDLHGEYELFMRSLAEVGFAPETDRLFSVGDLIDRGPDSLKCLSLINEPWFFPVRGNHEQLLINAVRGTYDGAVMDWIDNGGMWGIDLVGDELDVIAQELDRLPYAIQVGDIGFVHAEPPSVWDLVKHNGAHQESMIWSRDRYSNKKSHPVEGIGHVFVGHAIVREVITLGNVSYVDRGAHARQVIEIINIQSFMEKLRSARVIQEHESESSPR